MPMLMPSTANLNLNHTTLCTQGHLKEALHILLTIHNPPLDYSTYLQLLQTCIAKKALSQGKLIHSHITHRGFYFPTGTCFQNNLINMYVKCSSLQNVVKVFHDMKKRDVISWNIIIAAYGRHGGPLQALTLFYQMQLTSFQPDEFTFASVIPACAKLRDLEQGMDIHKTIMERGFLSDVVVARALIDMYGKCGSIHKAHQMFDKMPQKDVISWNAMIAGYVQNGFVEKALETFKQMKLATIKPDSTTFAKILLSCAKMGSLEQGAKIHQRIIERGILSDIMVTSALVDMYEKCGSIHRAGELFDNVSQKDVVSWTAMIVGYVQNGFVEKALTTFKKMELAGLKPNCTTFLSILPGCAKMGALEQGMNIHQNIIESGFSSNVVVASSLVDLYAKCGFTHKAHELFNKTPQRNLVFWTAMIAGYAQNGFCKDALKLFELMKDSGMYPNDVSFMCVLSACTHVGLVDAGCKYFNITSDFYCIAPTIDHYVCMIDLLGRASYLEETLKFIVKIPIKPVLVVWTCLLFACRSHKNIGLGAYTTTHLFELDPKDVATYVLLGNIYVEVGRWSEGQMVRILMKDKGIKNKLGCSWIEGHKIVHVFCVGDRSHPRAKEIYAKLETLSWEMKAVGCFPGSRHVLNDVEEEEKELFICHHSEKLAIVFELLNTAPRTTIRVVKNLRVCVDCHTATKFISNIVARQIVVRDAIRFNHFKQGQCSCGDYW